VEGVPPAASNGVPGNLTLETLWAVVQVVESRLRQLESRVRELEASGGEFRRALNRLGDALAATHDRPAMLSAVLDTCALYLRAPSAVFYGSVAGTERLRPLASCGAAPAPEDLTELKLGDGLAGTAAASGDVMTWPGSADVAPSPDEPAGPEARTAMAVPIRSGNRPFGVLALYGRSVERAFTREDVDALVALVRQVETAIENSFLYEEATRLSITDGLTSLWNRRQFDLRVGAEHQRGVRFAEPFSIILLDLDQLKAVNDSLGHQAGDALLIEVAHRLASGVRDVDLVSRFGGDEFGLVLPSTGVAGALRVAEKVRAAIGGAPIDVGGGTPVRATVSVGVASYPEHGPTGRQLVRAADAALYRAKAAGGNRVAHAKVEW
jgi:two-component system, cell cycle response regulator